MKWSEVAYLLSFKMHVIDVCSLRVVSLSLTRNTDAPEKRCLLSFCLPIANLFVCMSLSVCLPASLPDLSLSVSVCVCVSPSPFVCLFFFLSLCLIARFSLSAVCLSPVFNNYIMLRAKRIHPANHEEVSFELLSVQVAMRHCPSVKSQPRAELKRPRKTATKGRMRKCVFYQPPAPHAKSSWSWSNQKKKKKKKKKEKV